MANSISPTASVPSTPPVSTTSKDSPAAGTLLGRTAAFAQTAWNSVPSESAITTAASNLATLAMNLKDRFIPSLATSYSASVADQQHAAIRLCVQDLKKCASENKLPSEYPSLITIQATAETLQCDILMEAIKTLGEERFEPSNFTPVIAFQEALKLWMQIALAQTKEKGFIPQKPALTCFLEYSREIWNTPSTTSCAGHLETNPFENFVKKLTDVFQKRVPTIEDEKQVDKEREVMEALFLYDKNHPLTQEAPFLKTPEFAEEKAKKKQEYKDALEMVFQRQYFCGQDLLFETLKDMAEQDPANVEMFANNIKLWIGLCTSRRIAKPYYGEANASLNLFLSWSRKIWNNPHKDQCEGHLKVNPFKNLNERLIAAAANKEDMKLFLSAFPPLIEESPFQRFHREEIYNAP